MFCNTTRTGIVCTGESTELFVYGEAAEVASNTNGSAVSHASGSNSYLFRSSVQSSIIKNHTR